MIALELAEIARAVDGVLELGTSGATPETIVDGPVETDNRDLVPGGVFVARRGETTDGHRFAEAAVEAGAALLLVERVLPIAVPQVVVTDATEALAALAGFVVRRVQEQGRLRIVGVTGSNGKTTTKNLLKEICGRAGSTVASRASFNNEVGGPLTMLELTLDTDYLVAEMGASHVGDIARLVGLAHPDVGVVLKVGLAHAGEFGGIEKTVLAKSEMVRDLTEADVAVLNRDDPRVMGMADVTAARVVDLRRRAGRRRHRPRHRRERRRHPLRPRAARRRAPAGRLRACSASTTSPTRSPRPPPRTRSASTPTRSSPACRPSPAPSAGGWRCSPPTPSPSSTTPTTRRPTRWPPR